MRWFVKGDIDGFFGLALDNVIQLLLIDGLCRTILEFPPELLYGRVLPGAAVSLLVGNLFYAHQARQLALKTGRTDVCALPYGINTVSLFAHIFLVMLPVRLECLERGLSSAAAAEEAWRAGLVACLGSGVIEVLGSFVSERIRRVTPRAALLSTLAGIALGFIALGFLFRTFARPEVGLVTLGIVLLTYFGRVRFVGGLPGGLVAVLLGTALAWATGLAHGAPPDAGLTLRLPVPVPGELWSAAISPYTLRFMTVILPMGIFNVIGSLQNIESAEAAGDRYETMPSLAVNGIGSVAAALFGSCFPTTIYIGHPGWKALGARAGYSILNGAFITLIALTGTLAYVVWAVPIDAGMAIVLWIGIVITAQAFQSTPREHAPAAVVGLLPGVGAWGVLMAKNALRATGQAFPDGPAAAEKLLKRFEGTDTWIHGGFALEQGFIFTAMLLSAATVFVIERRFRAAACCCFIAAALSAAGLMHSYTFTPGDTVGDLFVPAWNWAAGYLVMGLCFALAPWVTRPGEGH